MEIYADWKDVEKEKLEEHVLQGIHMSFPCHPFKTAGMRQGRKAEQANFLEPCAAMLRTMWDGEGIPFFTYENVPGVQDLLFEGEIIEGFKELFPQYHIWVGVIKAADVVSPLTRAQCATTKANLWITGANKKWFDGPIDQTESGHQGKRPKT